MAEKKLIRKNLDVTEQTAKTLSIEAIEKGFKTFKEYAQHLLEAAAEKAQAKKKAVSLETV